MKDAGMSAAIEEARLGLEEGGIPIGSALVLDGHVVGRGHNQRVQKGSTVFHAEMDALEDAGRLRASEYRRSVLFTTLSPCEMCSGAVLLYEIPCVVVGENRNFIGAEEHLRARGVIVDLVDDQECVDLLQAFIARNPDLWNEDIGED